MSSQLWLRNWSNSQSLKNASTNSNDQQQLKFMAGYGILTISQGTLNSIAISFLTIKSVIFI